MCFSEEVSFATAGTLAVITAACFYSARKRNDLYALAAIPLFFGLQQAAEGIQWLVFKNIWGSSQEALPARDLYLFIAYALWPFWIPFSLWTAEKNPARKKWLQLTLFLGLALALYQGWILFNYPVSATAEEGSIRYSAEIGRIFIWPYLAVTIIPWFISSLRYTALVGALMTIGMALASYFYYIDFVSIWCFFAAIVGVLVLLVIKNQTHTESFSRRH